MNLVQHNTDADCTVDEETECCIGCGVDHSKECSSCAGRGYHADDCEEMAEWRRDEEEHRIEAARDEYIRKHGDR
jgi:hypothetical protein